jgi:hypothetical protein
MKPRLRTIDNARKDSGAIGRVFHIHASWCPWSSGSDVCTCVPYHVFPSDDRPTAEIVETVERRQRG